LTGDGDDEPFASSRRRADVHGFIKRAFGTVGQARQVVLGVFLPLPASTVGITSWLLLSNGNRIIERSCSRP